MPKKQITTYFLLSILTHLFLGSGLFYFARSKSQLVEYTNFDVAVRETKNSRSVLQITAASQKKINSKSISQLTASAETRPADSVAAAPDSKNENVLPLTGDSQLITQGLRPINLPEINKSIKRTQEAIEKNIEGQIKLKLFIDDAGKVRQVTVLSKLGFGLDEVAVAAAWKLLFVPARIGPQAVPTETIYTVKFNITHD